MASGIITGFEIGRSCFSWTSLRRKKKRVDTSEQKELEVILSEPDAEIDLTNENTIHQLKKAVQGLEGEMCVGLPAARMLMRVTELPSVDAMELESMVELQVDKFCPFAIEQMAYSYEVLHQRDTSTRVLIVAVKQSIVDELGNAFRSVGTILHRVDCRLSAWWALLREHGELSEHGQQSILIVEPGDVSLIVLHHGLPVVFRSVGTYEKYTTDVEVDELIEEIDFTLTMLEAEWESAEDMKMSVWSFGGLSDLLKKRLGESAVHGAVFHDLKDLPPLSEGLARRGLLSENRVLNLAPEQWHADEKYRHTLRSLGVMSIVFLCCWVSAIAFFIVYMKFQWAKIDELTAGQEGLQEQVDEFDRVRDKVQSLKQYSDRSYSALEIIREVSVLLPEGVDLSYFNYKKSKTVTMKGTAAQAGPIHDFSSALEQSGKFEQVTPDNIVTKGQNRGNLHTEFTITLSLPGGAEQ